MDRLVKTIVSELEQRGATAPSGQPGSGGGGRSVALVDNWRVRAEHRAAFLSHYQTHVADVIAQIPGYVSGRVFSAQGDSSYSWHVQAYFEFASADVVTRFRKEFDKAARKVKPGLTLEKVLDAMDPWVLAHEDGVLDSVWS